MNWKIEQLIVKQTDGDLQNVVVTASWRCNGEETSGGKTYTATCYGTVSFEAPDPSAFVPYPNLTEQDVLNWVWSSDVDKTATEAIVQQQIDNQINPPVIVPPLPWS
jgi:hypothetical protein